MKLVVRTMGSLLIATVVVALIFALISSSFIPGLSNYISDTMPSEKNLELISVVAADPAPDHSAPADGETYSTDTYVYTYVSTENGWSVAVKDKEASKYAPLFETIYGKPLISLNNTFSDCSNLVASPAIPKTVTDMTSAYANCASLTGTIVVYANPTLYDDCLFGTVKAIELTGNSTVLSALQATSASGNVLIKE